MSSGVTKQPANVPLVDPKTGLITREWYRFFTDAFTRFGGNTALTNTELASLSDGKYLGIYSLRPSQQLTVKQGDGLIVSQDVTGYTVSVDLGQVLGFIRAFLQKQEPVAIPAADDVSRVLATRVFGA